MEDMSFWDVVMKRRSVRVFTDKMPSEKDIRRVIDAACRAPSGKNKQNWHFTVISDSEMIGHIADLVTAKNGQIAESAGSPDAAERFRGFSRYSVFFRHAPVLILVFAGPYNVTGAAELKAAGLEDESRRALETAPGIQSVAAAMENLLLAAAALGLGTCWMTSANYAAAEIVSYVGRPAEGFELIAMTPLGYPADGTAPGQRDAPKAKVTFLPREMGQSR